MQALYGLLSEAHLHLFVRVRSRHEGDHSRGKRTLLLVALDRGPVRGCKKKDCLCLSQVQESEHIIISELVERLGSWGCEQGLLSDMGLRKKGGLLRALIAASSLAAGGAFHHGAALNPMMLSRGRSSIVHSPGPSNTGTGRFGGTTRLTSGGQGSRRTALLPQVGSRRPGNLGGTWQRSKEASTVSRNVGGAGREGEGSWELLDQLCADFRVRRVAAWFMFAVVCSRNPRLGACTAACRYRPKPRQGEAQLGKRGDSAPSTVMNTCWCELMQVDGLTSR